MPESVRASFQEALPIEPRGAEASHEEFVEKIRP